MKKIRVFAVLLSAFLFVITAIAGAEIPADNAAKKIVILFTHDLHSYFLPQEVPGANGGHVSVGGYARIATLIRAEKEKSGEGVVVLDGGDFSMGTLFHTLYMTEAADLRMLGTMGFDATTPGNHEFDFGTDGFARSLKAAREKEKLLPEILSANIGFGSNCALKSEFAAYPVKPYIVLNKNGVRIGIFGIIGKDAADDAPFSKPAVFADPVETSRAVVRQLREKEKADIVVCISHSGTFPVKKYSEDEILAEKVPGIDVIVSGHTHTLLEKPLLSGKTVIGSAFCYGNYLGRIELEYSKTGGPRLVSYKLIPVGKNIPEDSAVANAISGFEKLIDREYLSRFGESYSGTVARSETDMESQEYFNSHPAETGLGDMICDAYRYAVRKTEGNRWEYVSLAIEPNGHIRDSFVKGEIRVPDVFRVLSLGLGPDKIPGYPLVAFYVTGRELKNILEVHASVAPIKPDAVLQVAGVRFEYNPKRFLFDRITKVEVENPSGKMEPLDGKRLYRVCMNYYSANMVAYVGKLTFGLLTMAPKDKNGHLLPDIASAIVDTDSGKPGLQELKEWQALAMYLRSFGDPDEDGLSEIPARYQKPAGRIAPRPSDRLTDIYSNGGPVTNIVLGLWIGVPLVVIVIILILARRRKKTE